MKHYRQSGMIVDNAYRLDRDRAWIFTEAEILVSGASGPAIQDGEAYTVARFFPSGVAIPAGESTRVGSLDDVAEFHYVQEALVDDVSYNAHIARKMGKKLVLRRPAFWMEPLGLDAENQWRVCYVARHGTRVIDVLCLQSKLPSRAKLFLAMNSSDKRDLKEQ